MGEFVFHSMEHYFNALKVTGYYRQQDVDKLLVLIFLYHFVYEDYRGYIRKEDCRQIEKALSCLYGTTCLITYPDYLKMGKLRLGEMTEVMSRVKAQEDNAMLLDQRIKDNDVLIADNTRRIDEGIASDGGASGTPDVKVVKGKNLLQTIPDLDFTDYDVYPDE